MTVRPLRWVWAWGLVTLVAGCSSLNNRTYPSSGPLVPTASIQLTSKVSYALDNLVMTAAGAWLAYEVFEPLAPNWQLDEAKVGDGLYVINLRMKRFHNGGDGEAMWLLRQRAEVLQHSGGYASYRIVAYEEGIQSSTPIPQRFSQGLIQLVKAGETVPPGTGR